MVRRFETGKTGNIFFPEILPSATVGLIEKCFNSQEKYCFVAEIRLILKLKEYTNDHRRKASIIGKL